MGALFSYKTVFSIVLLWAAGISGNTLYAGDRDMEQGITVAARVQNGDTLIVMQLDPVSVVAPREFGSRREARRHDRLVRNVKVVYPYARLAGIMFTEYSNALMEMESERERRQYTEQAEKELREHFEDDLKRLTFSQGLILIKLIDRETQHTSYDIVREFRGMFSAFFWQSLGRLFGYNLKTEYDPYGEDRDIEEIVQLIEEGLL